jgi:hypothetical protein
MEVGELPLEQRRSLFVSLDALRYTRSDHLMTKFDAVCSYDLLDADNPVFSSGACSPVLRDSLALGVGAGIPVHGGAEVGLDAIASAHVGVLAGIELGVDLEFPIQRRFKYPLGGLQAARAPGHGGNILVESELGPIVAGQAIIVQHDCDKGLTGKITYVVTYPAQTTVIVGARYGDASRCWNVESGDPGECPAAFENNLSIYRCSSESATAGTQNEEVDFDMAELVEALDQAHDTITTIKGEIQQRSLQRTTEIVETFRDNQSEFFMEMRARAEQAVENQLDNIRDIARDLVCPKE